MLSGPESSVLAFLHPSLLPSPVKISIPAALLSMNGNYLLINFACALEVKHTDKNVLLFKTV